MARPQYRVRRFRQCDKKKLLDVFQEVWGRNMVRRLEGIWDWKYERNPHNPPEGHNSLVLECDGEPVGFLGYYSNRVKVGDKIVPIAWGSEFSVDPRHKGRGYLVIKRATEQEGKFITGTASDPRVYELEKRVGGFDVTCFENVKCVLEPEHFLRTRTSNPVAVKAGGAVLSLLRKLARIRIVRDRDLEIRRIEEFGPEFDEFWPRVSRTYRFIPLRDRRFLNWRFRDCPVHEYTMMAAYDGDRVKGYVVLRDEHSDGLHRGFIVDILAARGDLGAYGALVGRSIAHFRSVGADIVSCKISHHDRATRSLLRRFGFLFASEGEHVVAGGGKSDFHRPLRAAFADAHDLVLTRADSDIDFNG